MQSRKKFNLALSLVIGVLVLVSFVGSVNAQKSDSLEPMKIADEFKNDYDFDDALEWYDKIIQDFPDTIAAGNASLNKLAILYAQAGYSYILALNFLTLAKAQYDRADEYSYGGSAREDEMDKYNELKEKGEKYTESLLQKGKPLREEFYRFEKKYASKLDKLSPPHIGQYNGERPPIVIMKEDDIERILALGNENYLEYESRKEFLLNLQFQNFCFTYMILGDESSKEKDSAAYYNKEYINHKIDHIGFYYRLGPALINSYQYKSAVKAFRKVIDLAKDEPYNKLAYDAKKMIKVIKEERSERIGRLKRIVSPAVIDKYVEPYTATDFSLGDLEDQASQELQVKVAWSANLEKMTQAYNKATSFEKKDVSPKLKVQAWQKFQDAFSENNPYTNEDDTMRRNAKKQLDYWRVQPEKSQVVVPSGGSKEITWQKDGAEMLLIPAGEFEMGSNDGGDDEKPVHTVYTDAFYMDKYEVTVGRYKKFINATGHSAPDWSSVSTYSPTDEHPMIYVSWNDAQEYCKWAGKRLPTEAEWEKAARGGLVGKRYPWGDEEPDSSKVNYGGNVGETTPVGKYPPNGYRLYDMAGNVWEWCSDWYDSNYYSSSPRSNPRGPSTGNYRLLRGGSWFGLTSFLRPACRFNVGPRGTGFGNGFRCCVSQDVTP